MPKTPLPANIIISIVIPALNEEAVIRNTLSALQPFRKHGHEVILVDGGSSDGTRGMAEGMADLLLTAPKGRALQMSAGAEAASGTVIWFLHADTMTHPQADRIILKAMEKGVWGRFDVRLSGDHPLLRIVECLMNIRSRLTGIATGDQGIFVRRDVLKRAGGVPRLRIMEDIELSRCLKRIGRPVCLRERIITSSRRWEENGVLSTILLMWRLRFEYALGADPDTLVRRYYSNN